MSGRRFWALLEREYLDFTTSKSWILALALPLFIGFLFNFVYRDAETAQLTVAYTGRLTAIEQRIFAAPPFRLMYYQDLKLARKDLSQAKIDALLQPSRPGSGKITLLANQTQAKKAALLINAVNVSLIQTFSNRRIPQIQMKYLNQKAQPRWLSVPIWLIQLILTIALLQAAAAVADEKEKQTLHSLLVSPVQFIEYMGAKVLWAAFVGMASIYLTLWLTKCPSHLVELSLFALLGCLIYAFQALLVGLFAPNALFARTIATVIYLVSTFPMMIADLAGEGKELLNLFPSYLILRGLEQAVQLQPLTAEHSLGAIVLGLETLALAGIAYYFFKQKADF
jgi:ABC-type Na+ efflux pump permease subunit